MRYIIFFILFLSCKLAFAADPATPDISIVNTINEAIELASKSIMPQALTWLGGFMGLQFVVTNINIIKGDGDLATVWAKFLGILFWFMFCFYVIKNGPDFIDSVGNGVLTKFAPNLPSPGSVIAATLGICSSILIGIAATGTSVAGIGNSSVAMVLVYVLFTVFAIGAFMAIKLIMLQLELGLIIMMAPLSFSFLGLNATKDQGIAPFKSLISIVYRIILLGIVFSAFGSVIEVTGAQLDGYSWKNPFDWGSKIQLLFAALFSFPVCAYLVWKSDSIAASLASGSTSMGTGDVASSAGAGGAVGGAIGSAAGSATKGLSAMPASLSGASVSNASSKGAGGFESKPVGTAPTPQAKKPEMSLADNNAARVANGPVKSSPSSSGGPSTFAERPSLASRQEARGGTSSSSSNSGSAAANKAANTIDNLSSSGQLKDTGSAKHVSDHLKSTGSSPGGSKAVGETPNKASPTDSGSGSSAGIGGASSATDQKLDKLMETMGQPNKPGLKDRLANANDHVANEQAATTVSISTHNTD